MRISDFDRTSPSRLFDKASSYTKHLGHYHDLPKNISKSMVVRQQAQSQKDEIDFAIKRSEYQLELYRKKEKDDMMRRTTFEKKFNESAEKVAKNERDIEAKKAKVAEAYEKHLRNTYRKYEDEEKKHRENEREQSYKLRKELKEFYEKEAERKKSAEFKQISVGTCYQSAVEKINNIHRRNQEYSLKAEHELNKELRKNSHFEEIITKKRRSVSCINEAKSKIYEQNMNIFEEREKSFIQKYGRNEDGSINAFKHIESQQEKEKKRIHEFFKKRVEKWAQDKKRVDEAKAQISQKCSSILQRTNNSFFRQTVSSFRSTSKQWEKIVERNKSAIKSHDEMKKDEIMDMHLDLRLKNASSSKVADKMRCMKLQAKKLASDYL